MKNLIFLFAFLPYLAFSQFGLGNPNRTLTELGRQTTARGIVYYAPGPPNTVITWRVNRDTAAYMWVDTLTSRRYEWNHAGNFWATQGIVSGASAPAATTTNGPAVIDNRDALWRSTADNLFYFYDRTNLTWAAFGSGGGGSDDQTLSFTPPNLTIENGNTVDLSDLRARVGGSAAIGVSGDGTPGNPYVITNLGDTDPTNDLTTSTTFAGDVAGAYNNLQLGSGVVGTAEIATSAVTSGKIATGAVGASELASTTVTAGTYGSATQVAQTTFDADGRATGASNVTIAIPSTAVTDFTEAAQDVTGGMVSAGTGISATYSDPAGTLTIANTAPDQTVSLTNGGGVTVSGTYPNFTLTATDASATNELQNLSLSGQALGISSGTGVTLPIVGVSAGAGISVSTASGVATVTNTAAVPTGGTTDQVLAKIDGTNYNTHWVTPSGGGGGGGVASVTGDAVDNTDPANPVVNAIPYVFPDEMEATGNNAFLGGTLECELSNFNQTNTTAASQVPFFGLRAYQSNNDKTFSLGFWEDGGDPFFSLESIGASGDYALNTQFSNYGLNVGIYSGTAPYPSWSLVAQTYLQWLKNGVYLLSVEDDKTAFNTPIQYKNLDTSARNALTPSAGWTIFCTDCTANDSSTGVVQTYNGSTWKNHW